MAGRGIERQAYCRFLSILCCAFLTGSGVSLGTFYLLAWRYQQARAATTLEVDGTNCTVGDAATFTANQTLHEVQCNEPDAAPFNEFLLWCLTAVDDEAACSAAIKANDHNRPDLVLWPVLADVTTFCVLLLAAAALYRIHAQCDTRSSYHRVA